MPRNNKQFVRNVVILAVVGLVTLMIVMFLVLQSYIGGQSSQSTYIEEPIEEVLEQSVELSETLNVLVEEMTDNHIMGYDIHNKKVFSKVIDESVKISDAYGNVLPINQIKTGDIVEVDYQKKKDKIVSMSKSSSVQSWNKISGVTVDGEAHQINIAGTTYQYTDETLVVDGNGIQSDMAKVGPFDIVSVQAVDNVIWSIIINEASASLNLLELPTKNGQIEIDNSRLLMFKDVKEPIKLVAGKHKIVIKMKGYVTIVENLELEAGEDYEMSLKDAEIAYTVIKPNISPNTAQYTITIGDKIYKPDEEIKLQQGNYSIEINAEGYEKYSANVSLEKDNYLLRVALIAIEEEETEEETDTTDTGTSTNTALNGSRTITVNTDPAGANVYINGELKGVTPYTVTLNNGSYGVLLEKTDYDIYSTNILLDGSNDQSSYLYKLTPRE